VYALAVSGRTVYAGGNFSSIGGKRRHHLAAVDGRTGNATAWNPGANGVVWALAVAGQTVYAGGQVGELQLNDHEPQEGFARAFPSSGG
jgi:hypothetical protein